jgi:hypothetical protein
LTPVSKDIRQMDEIRTGPDQGRNDEGKFIPGVSGNPAGRPRGIVDKRVKAKEDLLGPLLPKAIQRLTAEVDKGERWAIELVVSFSIPKPRPVDTDEMRELEERLVDLEQLATRQ